MKSQREVERNKSPYKEAKVNAKKMFWGHKKRHVEENKKLRLGITPRGWQKRLREAEKRS